MRIRRLWTRLVAASAAVALCTPVAAQDPAVCPAIRSKAPEGANGALFVIIGGAPVNIADARISQLRNGKRDFYYFLSRSDGSRPGAINVLFEMRAKDGARDDVGLHNNDKGIAVPCKSRRYRTYQAFHQTDAADECLRDRFHNSRGRPFQTLQPSRRAELAFRDPPSWNFAQIITGKLDFGWFAAKSQSGDPVTKRASRIINYTDFQPGGSCIHFHIDIPGVTNIRVNTVDLLPDGTADLTRRSWTVSE